MSVLRTQLRGVARRPSRLLLTGLAVLVVSFVVYATVLAQQITERTVLNSLSGTPEAADVVVHDGMITSAELAAVRKIPGVAETVGRVDNGAQIGGEYLSLLSDPGTGPLSQVTVAQGRYPSEPGEIAVTPRTVERMGLQLGKTVTGQIRYDEDGKPLESSKLTVVGVVDVRDDFGFQAYGPTDSIMKLGGYDGLSRIELRLAPGTDASAVMDRINTVFTSATKIKAEDRPQVQDGDTVRLEEAETAASEINSIFAVIAMFIAIAVVAAGLVATSTFRIVFAQRMRQLALLRAVGAGRGPITRALAAEGALTGLVTGVAGVLIALGVGHLFPVVAGWFGKSVFGPGFPLLAALLTVLLAVFLTTVAVLAPAASASRVSPLEALRGAGTTGARRDIGKLRWATGLLFVLGAAVTAGYIVSNLPGRDTKDYDPQPMLLALVASGAFAFFALVALGPVLVRPVLALIGWPLRRSSPVG
ncbi:MAG: ABC transporter permease, partial [Actinomycetota bacterium]|nr:ABC transporter permease [Actinomycetota bacterium]